MLKRRFVLQRDPPFDAVAALTEIRRLMGWGSSDICFILNVPRPTLAGWEVRGSRPNVDDGDAIRKLLAFCRNCDARRPVAALKMQHESSSIPLPSGLYPRQAVRP